MAKYITSSVTIADVVAEFESSTENSALKSLIVAEIEGRDTIPFRDFMAMALYHPEQGYYNANRPVIGRDGDYLTSPEVSPLFGAMMGRQIIEVWEAMDAPPQFAIVEGGAGNGTLARDILSWVRRAAPRFFAAITYTVVDISESLRDQQRSALAAAQLTGSVVWADTLPGGISGCIISNELLDALPVHRVLMEDGRLREIHVTWNDTGFHDRAADSTPLLHAYFERLALWPGEGCAAEVNLEALDWICHAAESIQRGVVITLDYGYEANELYAPWRKDGTLLGFYRHNPSTDPYARLGRQDLTSHVDFTSIRAAGEEAGLTTLGLVSQSEFLANLGIQEALQEAEGLSLEERFARRRAVMELVDPGALGRIKVLVQSKGVKATLSGLRPPATTGTRPH